ncbi:ComEA family DNA-binding protein [Cryptobacterium curtum]|uniref:ComEA family DNA-binding protein n=1 Tax=Cryptobacterium curtum TaxID=84163 RepID=UPI0028D5C4CB|nr:ComEA family DNA-binding protein [Cryptobacterium curtum]
MPFIATSERLASRLHLSSASRPALAGVILLVLVALVLMVHNIVACAAHKALSEEISQTQSSPSAAEAVSSDDAVDSDEVDGSDESRAHSAFDQKKVIVHVSGHVVNPGVYELSPTDRVEAAVEAAGGMSEDADANGLNLARVVQDGEQIYVPGLATDDTATNQSGASSSVPSTSTSSKSSSQSAGSAGSSRTQKVNINTADANELCSLPGVGQSTAQKIITYRQTEGRFATKEDLKQVSGIGEKKYAALADFITV